MNIAFITGTSSGIGEAMARQLLSEGWRVHGFSRRKTIGHEHYHHISIDLAESGNAGKVNFDIGELGEVKKWVLVNNAAAIQPIAYLGNMTAEEIERSIHLNFASPTILINNFLKHLENRSGQKIIINVTSGAAERPMDGLGLYCSAKAALNMLTQVVGAEQKIRNNDCTVRAIAPGIVDTGMQDTIRDAGKEEFSRINTFVDYKRKNELKSPQETAKEYVSFIQDPDQGNDLIFRFN